MDDGSFDLPTLAGHDSQQPDRLAVRVPEEGSSARGA